MDALYLALTWCSLDLNSTEKHMSISYNPLVAEQNVTQVILIDMQEENTNALFLLLNKVFFLLKCVV